LLQSAKSKPACNSKCNYFILCKETRKGKKWTAGHSYHLTNSFGRCENLRYMWCLLAAEVETKGSE
jgi:hypothetical protein